MWMSNPQYHNGIVSGIYVGWTEIRCISCGVLLGIVDSTREDIYDYSTCVRIVSLRLIMLLLKTENRSIDVEFSKLI